MRPRRSTSTGLLTLILGAALSCGRDPGDRTLPVDLFRRLEAAPSVRLVVDDAGLSASASGARDRLAELGWNVQLGDDEAPDDAPRIRVGSFEAGWARRVGALLGWTLDGKQLRLAGRTFRAAECLLIATLPDPERPGLPLTVVLASRPAALAFGLDRVLPGWRPSALVWTGGDLRLELALDPRGRPRLDRVVDVDPPWRADARGYRTTTHEPARIHARSARGVSPDHARAIVDRLAGVRARVAQLAPPAGAVPRVTRVVLESSVDRLAGYPVGNELAFGDPWPARVLALAGEGLPDASGAAAARLWLSESWGAPACSWIAEGAACERADLYWGRGLEEWGARLLAAGLFPDVRTLLVPRLAGELSAHRRAPARGLLARYLLETRGPEALARLWRGSEELVPSAELESGFRSFVEGRLASRTLPALERGVPAMRGAAFTNTLDPRARSCTGWGSTASLQSLRELRARGANAVSLPCFYADHPDGGDGRPVAWTNASGALDGDAAVATVVAQARGAGLAILLGFEFLSRPAGTWQGDRKRLGPDAWRAFFERYERAVRHYALLAELLDADLLSVGSGMVKASSTAGRARAEPGDDRGSAQGPAEPEMRRVKREGWSGVIACARDIYRGPLTFSAGWPHAQRIDFWDQLDAVGAALHSDLRSAGPAGGSVDPGARRAGSDIWPAERFAREVGKPLIVTEIGFRSTARAAAGVVDSGGELDPAVQARLLRELAAALHALEAKGQAPRGLLLWKWSSDPDAGGAADRGYSPQGKPARASLATLFE